MAGIYIHIPFCRKACHYCNFHFTTNMDSVDTMVDAILKEIGLRKDYLNHQTIESIYFGGGTPSVLSEAQISDLLNEMSKFFRFEEKVEVTLEANPDDLSKDYLETLKRTGINRLSIGVQSFFEEDLIWMNRSHDANQAQNCIIDAQNIGFEDISVDLIFGCPDTNMVKWKQNLEKITSLDVPHVSCYGITVEERTALHLMIQKGKTTAPNESMYLEQFNFTDDYLTSHGFEHYEISNYAKEEKYAVHNTNYWRQKQYLGLGPSAHSFDGQSRQWNVNHNLKYLKALSADELIYEVETLTRVDVFNEYLMTGLRTQWGCDLKHLEFISKEYFDAFLKELEPLLDEGIINELDSKIYLSKNALGISDNVIAQLFIVNEGS